MEQKDNIRNSFFKLGNGKKMIVGALLLLFGMIVQSFPAKTLAQIPFLCMAMGLMCFVNALVSRITRQNINLFLFLAVQLAALEFGLSLTVYQLPGTGEELDASVISVIWIVCILAAWQLLGLVFRRNGVSRWMAFAALAMFLCALAALVAFVVPIVLSVLI